MPVLKRLAEVSDRFSYTMLMLVCKGIIRTRQSVYNLIFASRNSAIARQALGSATAAGSSASQPGTEVTATVAPAPQVGSALPPAAKMRPATSPLVPGVLLSETVTSSPRLNRGMAADRRVS